VQRVWEFRSLALLKLYGHPTGSILRCSDCYAALIRVVAHEPEYWLGRH